MEAATNAPNRLVRESQRMRAPGARPVRFGTRLCEVVLAAILECGPAVMPFLMLNAQLATGCLRHPLEYPVLRGP